jgi:DnaA family protein
MWIYGPDSVGKTHLLQAVCAQAGSRGMAAAYMPLADSALAPDLLSGCDGLSFVCLDDFERIAKQDEWERAVFRLYTELEDSGGRLLIAARSAPTSVGINLKDLSSRLVASTLLKILPLDDAEQCAALMLRASSLGMELPEDVAHFLMRRLPRDMATLCDALDRLDRASLATQRRLTVPFVRTAFETLQNGQH